MFIPHAFPSEQVSEVNLAQHLKEPRFNFSVFHAKRAALCGNCLAEPFEAFTGPG